MRGDERGIAGFFVDGPVLLIIIIALSIFSASVYHSYQVYEEGRRTDEMEDWLEDFIHSVRTCDCLTDSPGVISGEKLSSLNNTRFTNIFRPTDLGFHYNITIDDKSGYLTDCSKWYSSGRRSTSGDIFVKRTAMVVRFKGGESHLVSVTVSIWEMS